MILMCGRTPFFFLCKSKEKEKCHRCRHFTALHGFSCSFCLQMNRCDRVSTAETCFSSHQHIWNTSYATSHWDFVLNNVAIRTLSTFPAVKHPQNEIRYEVTCVETTDHMVQNKSCKTACEQLTFDFCHINPSRVTSTR